MADAHGVLIVAEHADGKLTPVSAELAGIGAQLAHALGQDLVAAVAADQPATIAAELGKLGVGKVYTVQHAELAGLPIEAHLAALTAIIHQANPRVVLIGRTIQGRDLGPRLAFRIDAGLAQDCVELTWDAVQQELVGARPVYGGASVARVAVKSIPAVATVRPKVFEPAPHGSGTAEVIVVPVNLDNVIKTKVLSRTQQTATGIKLEDARIVVSGGRGLGGPEPFKMLAEVAHILKAGLGASRAACDAGWVPHTYQIGLTGKSISADLYITVGISGASQHLAGISTVKNIVAINKDGEANIFKEARYGVVGDYAKVIPAFLNALKELNL